MKNANKMYLCYRMNKSFIELNRTSALPENHLQNYLLQLTV